MHYSSSGRGRSYGNSRPARFTRSRFPTRSSIPRARYVSPAVEPLITETVFTPEHTFADFGLDEQLLKNVLDHGYSEPTPIQDQAIPLLMAGKDVVGIANTGTGKTAAFLLPLINKVINNPEEGVLILAPTRELAVQIYDELAAFTRSVPVGIILCIGGKSLAGQVNRLRKNPHFIIGTPGRLKDLIERDAFRPAMFTNIVLDEVDRMLDIGFRQDILFLIRQLSPERQSLLFSATVNRETQEIIRTFLTDPVTVSVKQQETALHVHQDVVVIKHGENKIDVLYNLLIQAEFEKVIVFGRTKHGINRLETVLADRGIRVKAIHGNKNQNVRQRSLDEFKSGRVQALLATDIVARGIDVEGVTHVINYDEPMTYDEYVHRIGRTGRAGKAGKALTFVG